MSVEVKKVSELVTALFSNLDSGEMKQANSFIRSWKEIVGEKIGAHSKILDVDRGMIIVEVDHPGWSQQLLFRKKQILDGLSRNYPDLCIKNMMIRVVSECSTPYIKQDLEVGSGVKRIEPEEADIILPETMDSGLKEVLEKLKNSIRKGKPVDHRE